MDHIDARRLPAAGDFLRAAADLPLQETAPANKTQFARHAGEGSYWHAVDTVANTVRDMHAALTRMATLAQARVVVAKDASRHALWSSNMINTSAPEGGVYRLPEAVATFLVRHNLFIGDDAAIRQPATKADIEAYRDLLQDFAGGVTKLQEQELLAFNKMQGMAAALFDMTSRMLKMGHEMCTSITRNIA
ncbi:hypothetical protein PTE30175_04262 [Pandoraea terrae]|uniref:Uncharacterized protein n=1 Tax=Pandoraea terrae TaxID=1537710 RepID=A0A5E4Y8S5_9BURK|nr:hypothetical protein [Pandoraea terrae]VVE45054.1 hypothetical protein PTE30175_04262 [Pandoraea terrae]